MLLDLRDYITYIREHKEVTPVTIEAYEDSLKDIGIYKVDTDKLPELYKQLLKVLPKEGYVNVKRYLAVLSAWAKRNGLEHIPKEINYYTLYDDLQKLIGSRAGYTDDQIEILFTCVKTSGNDELYKAMLLMYYSGLRVGALKGIRYKDIAPIEEHPDMYFYLVKSKGRQYNAVIPLKVLDYCRTIQHGGDLLVWHDDNYATEFTQTYRNQMIRVIESNKIGSVRDGTSIFQSFRKAFSQKLLKSDLDYKSLTYKALIGHLPKDSTAIKFYITPEGKMIPKDLLKKMAVAYKQTELFTGNVGLLPEVKN